MKIAIFGSNSNIAKDVISIFSQKKNIDLDLYSRRDTFFSIDLNIGDSIKKFTTLNYDNFNHNKVYDAIINFIGKGNPAEENDSNLITSAYYYDSIILEYLLQHKLCKYIYISSGAVYGNDFLLPISELGRDIFNLDLDNNISNYAKSKLNCEKAHSNEKNASIFDLRIFNYFSHRGHLVPGFLMSDICRSILDKSILWVSKEDIVRDYIDPDDFCTLLEVILNSKCKKMVIDCRSRKKISKFDLLALMKKEFGLIYKISKFDFPKINNLNKKNYYSMMSNDRKLGFNPKYSSEESLVKEVKKLITMNDVK